MTDELIVREIARAINNARYDYLADDYEPTDHELYVARAAHAVISAKIEELTGANARLRRKLKEFGCEVIEDVDAHIAALAPHPEGTDQ